ncbi:hypothetical protein IGL16_000283 [Enterococcus sp. AZ117]|uniref:lectin-like domain-containing protein n=1 Tax=unclassified Enterococcus TaxID=2608891 RepID=UPI00192046B5
MLAITQILYVGFNFTSAEAQGTVDSSRAVVDKDNFLYFFRLNGNSTYDASSGILTLTTDEKYKAGNAALKTQIDINSDFTLDGEVNIGNKNKAEKGADGISFGFHPNPTDIIGGFGSTLGLGNIPNAFGWKADTYYNAGEDRITGNGRFHAGPDPKRYETSSFGAFMYNQVDSADSEKIWTNTYDEPDAPAQEITRPTDNQFKPIKFVYSGYSKTLSVEYDGKRWSKQVDKYFVGELSTLLISASTGGSTNLQQFKLNKFDFVPNKGILETNKVSDVKEAKLGDIITYTIEAKNLNKDTSLLNVVVEDELPEGLELVPDTLAINGESVVNESIKENGIKTKLDVITYEVPIFITFNARVTKQDSGRLTNTAKVTTEYPEDSQTPTNDVDVTETPTPTRPVDPEGNEIPHEGIDFPSYPGKPGDKIVIPNKDIPEIPGYDKPTGDIEVTIPEPGNSIDIPYVPKKDTETPTRPVDPEGNEIPHEGIDFPSYPGKPGDKIVIPNKDIPEIPGYDKPTGDIEVTIPEPGNSIDIPYVPKKETEIPNKPKEEKDTPTRPVDPEGKEIPHEGIDFPSYPGKPGDKIVIPNKDIPEIPGYDKPTGDIEVTIPEPGNSIDIPYVPKKETEIPNKPKEEKDTPTHPVDPEGKEIPHEGIDFPRYPGKPGDKIVIPNKDIPEIPGYDKPTGNIEVTIPESGNSIDIPYIPKKNINSSNGNEVGKGFRSKVEKNRFLPSTGTKIDSNIFYAGLILLVICALGIGWSRYSNKKNSK